MRRQNSPINVRHKTPHLWQSSAISRWQENRFRGVIKVCTGGGKTLMALFAAELAARYTPGLLMAIVVPTIELQRQWYSVLLEHANCIPGRLGDGYHDKLPGCQILIAVLASAREHLAEMVNSQNLGKRLFLIIDECHKSGATDSLSIYDTKRAYTLGLSATPERDEDEVPWLESPLAKHLGPIVYRLTLRQAAEQDLLSDFVVEHYGIPLGKSGKKYQSLTYQIDRSLEELTDSFPFLKIMSGNAVMGWARSHIGISEAAKYVSLSNRRKLLLYRLPNRAIYTVKLIHDAVLNGTRRAIVFHEQISEVDSIHRTLVELGIPVVKEHSQIHHNDRRDAVKAFRDGRAWVMVSAKTLIEGVDIPAAELGIIAASSSSTRQRIQTIGRLLRKSGDKFARICALYASATVDENIYVRENWDHLIGKYRNRYFVWQDPNMPPIEKFLPPRG